MGDEKEVKDTQLQGRYTPNGGFRIAHDGKMEKSEMLDLLELDLDDYSDCEKSFSLEDTRRFRMHMMNMRTGVQAMAPILCSGPIKCPFIKRCPLVDMSLPLNKQNIKKWPLQRQCPVERGFLNFRRRQYLDEYDADIDSPTELGMVNKLAELDLYEYRVTLVLAHGDADGDGLDLMKSQKTGKDLMGDEMVRLESHPAWELKQKIHKQRMEILESLVGTRKEKYKRDAALKQKEGTDTSSVQSALKKKLDEIRDGPVIDVEYHTTDEDKDKV